MRVGFHIRFRFRLANQRFAAIRRGGVSNRERNGGARFFNATALLKDAGRVVLRAADLLATVGRPNPPK